MYDEFINIFKANNIPFEEYSCKREDDSIYCREIQLEGGTFFFDEYDEFTKAIYYH